MRDSPLEKLNAIAQIIYDRKGSNILALDVRGLSSLTDYLLIAEGNVSRHLVAMATAIIDGLEDEKPLRVEGMQGGDWVVLDYGEIMVHLFLSTLRTHYALEKLFPKSKIVDLEIDISDRAMGDSKL